MDYPKYTIISKTTKQYNRFNTVGAQLIVRLFPPPSSDANIANHFQDSEMQVLDYALRDTSGSDMVGIVIRNEHNQKNEPVGVSFRRKDQLPSDVI
jgi:hypothetical protein